MRRGLFAAVRRGMAGILLSAVLAACGSDAGTLTTANETAVIGQPTLFDVSGDNHPGGRLSGVNVVSGGGSVAVVDQKIRFLPERLGGAELNYTLTDTDGRQTLSQLKVTVTAHRLSYVGTERCLTCHAEHSSFLLTGHNFKLNPVKEGKAPSFPYTDVSGAIDYVKGTNSSLGDPTSFEDVSYVIGGYMRTVMFLDRNGHIFAGDTARLDLPAEGEPFGPEHTVPVPVRGPGADTRPYVCARCHTTGWLDYTSTPGDQRHRQRQHDLAGMTGTFKQPGIQCEACHGAGSEHVAMPRKDNITRVAKGRSREDLLGAGMGFGEAIACGECHSEDGQRHYPSFLSHYNADFGGDSLGGRIMEYPYGGRYTLDGLLGMDPDSGVPMGAKRAFQCTQCHNPHKSTTNRDKPEHAGALKIECQDCHTVAFNEEGGLSAHQSVATCADCHLPASAHIFKIDLSAPSDSAYHLSQDGRYRQPWLRAVDACKACHQEDYDQRAAAIDAIHQ
ncbi:cytochrome c family protein [Marinobacter hydrocarbonoclasticus]|nr:cytochrome c family protein [Marinobacter nauticus]